MTRARRSNSVLSDLLNERTAPRKQRFDWLLVGLVVVIVGALTLGVIR